MTDYPYTQRNLFEDPEHYHYAKCNAATYLRVWKKSRCDFIDRLVLARPAAAAPTIGEKEPLETYLAGLISEITFLDEFSTNTADAVQRLVQKYEVSRQLYQQYSLNWQRLDGVPTAGLQTYLNFAEILVLHCQYVPRDRQKLSTLLKVCDALTSLKPAVYSATQSLTLETILTSESELVELIAGAHE